MTHNFLPINPARPLTSEEEGILRQLLLADFPGRDELLNQVQSARVTEECKECRSIVLLVDKLPSNEAPVQRRVPVEAQATDVDGTIMHILLHVVHGFLDEMELFREDLESIKKLPRPDSLMLINISDDL